MAQFPGWIEDYFQTIPRHPVDYFEQPKENKSMSEKFKDLWSYNPFKSLLADFDLSDSDDGEEGKDKENAKKKATKKSSTKPKGTGNVHVPQHSESVSDQRERNGEQLVVVERVTERLGRASDHKSSGGGGAPGAPEKEKGQAEGEQEPNSEGDSDSNN
jgi:hypothetical protein